MYSAKSVQRSNTFWWERSSFMSFSRKFSWCWRRWTQFQFEKHFAWFSGIFSHFASLSLHLQNLYHVCMCIFFQLQCVCVFVFLKVYFISYRWSIFSAVPQYGFIFCRLLSSCLIQQLPHVLCCDRIHEDALSLLSDCGWGVSSINKQDGKYGVEFDDFSHRVKRLEWKAT